jgi:hypothetical protein
LLVLFGLLSVADLLLTCWLLRKPGDQFYEANPVARQSLRLGLPGLAAYKAGVVLLVAGLTAVIARQRPQAAGRVLAFGCSITAAVVVYSVLLSYTPANAARTGPFEQARISWPTDIE